MCVVCGCSETPLETSHSLHEIPSATAQPHPPHDDLDFGLNAARASVPGMSPARLIQLETNILSANDRVAQENRAHFAAHGVTAINLVSSPGSGKTTLLCATIAALKARYPKLPIAVIEGDQQTTFDADRVRATGVPAIQVNTGKGCHLDAVMVRDAFARLPLHVHAHHHDNSVPAAYPDHHPHLRAYAAAPRSLLFIENVGNLVCPALWDLGEAAKVVILSVTEGEDKPLKYPEMFAAARLMILNKVDLLPHLSFDVDRCLELAHRVNPKIEVVQLSATTGEGMAAWLHWLEHIMAVPHPHSEDSEKAALRRRVAELEAELAQARAAAPATH